jgi:hypothetical protein
MCFVILPIVEELPGFGGGIWVIASPTRPRGNTLLPRNEKGNLRGPDVETLWSLRFHFSNQGRQLCFTLVWIGTQRPPRIAFSTDRKCRENAPPDKSASAAVSLDGFSSQGYSGAEN